MNDSYKMKGCDDWKLCNKHNKKEQKRVGTHLTFQFHNI